MKKLILFELNEVPQKIIDYYCQRRPNSWLAVHYPQFKKFNSFSENTHHLNPWNTWPTLHRGVDSSRHQILDLNQDLSEQNRCFPAIWDLLDQNNIKVGVMGSLHSYPLPKTLNQQAFYVPDVFSLSEECFPGHINTFQSLNLSLSRESARNVSKSVPKRKLIELAIKSPMLGFRAKTIAKISSQLLVERRESWKATRRRTHQANLSFDIFYKLLSDKKPDFTTFYTNHVAATQHRYWAATFPDSYEKNFYDHQWIDTYEGEILFALDATDEMFKRLDKFIRKHNDYQLVIASSMGQDAVKAKPIHTQLYIDNANQFFQHFGINNIKSLPAMLPQFNYRLSDENLNRFLQTAKNVTINGKALRYRIHGKGIISIEMGHINQDDIQFKINEKQIESELSGLKNIKIKDQSSTTADHIPEGILYSYHPSYVSSHLSLSVVPTREIFSSILRNYNVFVPDYAPKGSPFIL